MTLEMRDKENIEAGKISYLIEFLRGLKYSENEIMEILQKSEGLSEEVVKMYLEKSAGIMHQIQEHRVFMANLQKIISDMKRQNSKYDDIILKLQKQFNLDSFDAEFYFNYIMKSDKQ